MRAAAISSRTALPARSPIAIDGALDLAGDAFDAGQRVGYGHTEVVVAVGGEDYVVDSRDAGFDQAEDRGVLLGGGVADGVGDVDSGGAGLDGDGDHLEEELGIGAGAVLGGELYVFGKGAGEADRLGGLVEGLVAGDAELALEMEVGGGEDDVDTVGGGGLDGAGGGLNGLRVYSGRARRCESRGPRGRPLGWPRSRRRRRWRIRPRVHRRQGPRLVG